MLRLAADDLDLARAMVVVPEGSDAIVTDHYGPPGDKTVLPCASRLYVIYQVGGPTVIRCFGIDGTPMPAPRQPEIGAVDSMTRLEADDILFAAGSYVEPSEVYRYRAASDDTEQMPLTSPPAVTFEDVTVAREFATSADGTLVPVNILVPKGVTLDGSNPCLATGYGGFGISLSPRVRPAWRVLFDHGFVVAVANLRGGGEYGEAWHRAGNLVNKQHVFDDFAAVLHHLTERSYTSPARLAIEGGSNGGLLMGAMLTQHPELVACVVSHVGLYDMLRSECSPNGAFNIPEFGTVADETQFQALHAYSPYHHVQDGTDYPAALFLTGANDPRVDPMHSRKLTARLQAAAPTRTMLLRTTASAGHGLDTSLSERIEEAVDVTAFLFAQLDVTV